MGEEGIHAEGFLSFEHEVDSPTDLVGEDGERFSLAVFADQAAVIVLGLFVYPEEETGCLGECPLEVVVSDLGVLGAELFSCRLSGAFDEAAVGDKILDPGEAPDVVDFVEEDEAKDLPHPWDTPEQVPAVDIVSLGAFFDVALELTEEVVVEVEQLKIDLDAFANRGIREAVGDSIAVCLEGDLLLELGQVVLTVGVLDVGEEFGALSHEVVSAAQEIPS
jgi:hypothetical protein